MHSGFFFLTTPYGMWDLVFHQGSNLCPLFWIARGVPLRFLLWATVGGSRKFLPSDGSSTWKAALGKGIYLTGSYLLVFPLPSNFLT